MNRRTAAVLVVSTSASLDASLDRTGPVIVEWLESRGFAIPNGPEIVADGEPFAHLLAAVLTSAPSIIVTTGGTGLSPDDRTPELTSAHIEREIPGIMEEIRQRGVAAGVPAALLTRGIAGFSGSTFIVTLPGSPGAVADGLAVLDTLLEHLLAQHSGLTGH